MLLSRWVWQLYPVALVLLYLPITIGLDACLIAIILGVVAWGAVATRIRQTQREATATHAQCKR
ncbi:hypothetical protein C3736_13765 [Escherichia coli]|nr:hypothetical protein ECB_02039 [Escherichia coli B str. REL606]ACT43863.1 hypothetical protein ECD_02039 [Escherichia coli BL21(DE3)]ARH97786.1 hypothetical protein B5762_02204 [Escherichia coli]EFN8413105.1 hypothetical protein [Escherichia coli O7]MQP50724.1 hypothetical protein [Escherichia coli OP50]QNG33011.1 hypothetical protein FFHJCLDM_02067 [Escherichia coli BL21]HAC37454.1 hypothetical protein [Shigella sp.]